MTKYFKDARYFGNKAEAHDIAQRLTLEDDDGWFYVVLPLGKFAVIEVRDEDRRLLGFL